MELLQLNIGIVECDSHKVCEAHYEAMAEADRPPQHEIYDTLKKLENHTFFRCQIQLGEKKAQFESPSVEADGRAHLVFETIEKAWTKIRGEIAPTPETPLIVLPS
jgi:hypothetical protein